MLSPVDVVAGLWLALWCAADRPCQFPTDPNALADAAASVARSSERPSESPSERPSGRPASLLDLPDDELRKLVEADPASIGSLSIGSPGSAVLFNAVEFHEGPGWRRSPTADWFATTETVEAIETAVNTVTELYPGAQPLVIGDISLQNGGRINRHESHQGGRDVDLGFYYKNGTVNWWAPGSAVNLDLAKNWALVRALVTRTDVEVIFLDTRIQRVLHKYAKEIGEDPAWLDRVFQFTRGYRNALIQHVPRHRTHYHVRFYNPLAQELGRRVHPLLVELEIMKPPVHTVKHVARSGQTLGQIAARYGTSVRAIMQANNLKTTQIRAGRAYRIPVRSAAPPSDPFVVPARLLPPSTPAAIAGIEWPTAEAPASTISQR